MIPTTMVIHTTNETFQPLDVWESSHDIPTEENNGQASAREIEVRRFWLGDEKDMSWEVMGHDGI